MVSIKPSVAVLPALLAGLVLAVPGSPAAQQWRHPFDFPQAEGFPDEFFVVVEIPAGSSVKYEVDRRSGHLFVDRFVAMPVAYPANYGSITQTLQSDSDPLDALVFTRTPLPPGVMVRVRPIGVLRMVDAGEADDKILTVPAADIDATYDTVRSHEDLSAVALRQVESFFDTYKRLESKPSKAELAGFEDTATAKRLIRAAFDRYRSAGAGGE
jgi:inorganic pyrophosphatase